MRSADSIGITEYKQRRSFNRRHIFRPVIASSVSVTSAYLPTADAPRYCRYAGQHWAQFLRTSNQKPPPPRNRNLFGVVLSVADRWRSSNDLLLLKSNVLRSPFLSKTGQQQKSPRQPLFSRVKQLINQVLLNMGLQWGDFNWEDFTVLIRRQEGAKHHHSPKRLR
jgi:hypothetical protein